MKQVMLMIGTRKGGFLAFSNLSRKKWELKGPFFKGVEVNHLNLIPGSPPTIYVAGKSAWWGPNLQISRDFGDTWEALTNGLPQINAFQNILLRAAMTTDLLDSLGVYVGTQGGQILASRDAGDHWTLLFNWLPPVYSLEAAIIER
ncbi:MAG: hypothetical protein HYW01_07115 [Deltaproteobacteria bacterium]|nr:hypothetical protein [Deltaproteobacteria bacterium]